MIERHVIEGHEIAIQLVEVAPRQVRWIWRIDDLHISKSSTTLSSRDIARSEALLYAQVMVARLESRRRAG